MSNLLSQLENNEAVLMMYLAGELPQEDCIEVQRMIERDSALRAQCVAMDRLMNRAGLSFAMDAALSAPGPAEQARQRLSPVFRQWAAERLARPTTLPQLPLRRTPWFLYPLGAAAVILVAMAVFWSSIEPDFKTLPAAKTELAYLPDWTELTTEDSSPDMNAVDAAREADTLIATFDVSRQVSEGESSGLVFAATEAAHLRELADQMNMTLPNVQ